MDLWICVRKGYEIRMENLIKIAVVGAGSIGREFALKYLVSTNGVRVVAVVDINHELASALAEDIQYQQAGATVIGNKYRETVDRSSINLSQKDNVPEIIVAQNLNDVLHLIDGVYVGTPPSTHAQIVKTALSGRKHVLLEKPIAISNEDADDIVNEAKVAKNLNLVVSLNIGMRYTEAIKETQKRFICDASPLNLKLKLHFRQWPREWQNQPWVAEREQGGPLLEVGTHWIFGILEIVKHNSFLSWDGTIDYPDGKDGKLCERRINGVVKFANGSSVIVDVDTSSNDAVTAGKDIYDLEISNSTDGVIMYDFTRLREMSGDEIALPSYTYGRVDCVTDFVMAIHGEDVHYVTPEEARNAQRIISIIRNAN